MLLLPGAVRLTDDLGVWVRLSTITALRHRCLIDRRVALGADHVFRIRDALVYLLVIMTFRRWSDLRKLKVTDFTDIFCCSFFLLDTGSIGIGLVRSIRVALEDSRLAM